MISLLKPALTASCFRPSSMPKSHSVSRPWGTRNRHLVTESPRERVQAHNQYDPRGREPAPPRPSIPSNCDPLRGHKLLRAQGLEQSSHQTGAGPRAMRSVSMSVRKGRQVPGARKVAIILTNTYSMPGVIPSSLQTETN